MPFVDLHSKADYASIFYTTNTLFSNVSGFNPEKPSIVILHPIFLDLSWIDFQLGDPRLNSVYNIFAFDLRSSGKSICRLSGRHDSWVDAADLAFCFQKLTIPPSHILALEGSSVSCATRFAVLFPEMCLSLTLVDVPAPLEAKWVFKNIDEHIHSVCFAEDVDSFEQAASECIEFIFGPRTDPDLVDDLISYWGTTHPPTDRARLVETTNVYINRTPLSPDVYASISQPLLIIQGDKNELCPLRYAEKLALQMTGVKNGVILFPVKGAGSMISVIPESASIVNAVFVNFLSQLPRHRSDIVRLEISIRDRMEIALQKFSEITGIIDVESLDPMCSLSFSSVSTEVAKAQTDVLRRYMKNADRAFHPASVEEWSLRRFSQRKGQKDEGNNKGINTHRAKQEERVGKSSSRLETQGSVESSIGKNAFTSTTPSLDKYVVKSQGTTLQRLRA